MPEQSETWFVYLARCADGTLYTGIARDVAARIALHDSGKGARYTRGRGPLTLLATRRCASKNTALRLELLVKRLGRAQKLALAQPERLRDFARRALRRRSEKFARSLPAGAGARKILRGPTAEKPWK